MKHVYSGICFLDHEYHVGRTFRPEALCIRQNPHTIEVVNEVTSGDFHKNLLGVRHQRDRLESLYSVICLFLWRISIVAYCHFYGTSPLPQIPTTMSSNFIRGWDTRRGRSSTADRNFIKSNSLPVIKYKERIAPVNSCNVRWTPSGVSLAIPGLNFSYIVFKMVRNH